MYYLFHFLSSVFPSLDFIFLFLFPGKAEDTHPKGNCAGGDGETGEGPVLVWDKAILMGKTVKVEGKIPSTRKGCDDDQDA